MADLTRSWMTRVAAVALTCLVAGGAAVAQSPTPEQMEAFRNLPPDQRSLNRWFDASCFAVPKPGGFGNSGNNILEGPGYNMQHLSIAKTFSLNERFKFTFTSAISNILNHPNFANPSGNISATNVGVVGGLVEGAKGRNIEIRGRIDF